MKWLLPARDHSAAAAARFELGISVVIPSRNGKELLEAALPGVERELQGITESSGSAGTDDEHDPEGATVAFERQHVAALVARAREPAGFHRTHSRAVDPPVLGVRLPRD